MSSSLAEQLELACLWEATAPKPGNVHLGVAFSDLCYDDFVASAAAATPWLARSAELGLGPAIEAAIEATQSVVNTNTNLGMVLLLAPLAAVPPSVSLPGGLGKVLNATTQADAAAVYRAIRRANPGGLGQADDADVAHEPTINLVAAMRLAADRDRVARQYVTGFEDVLRTGLPLLNEWGLPDGTGPEIAVVGLQLSLLAEIPDSLIARKCGRGVAEEASRRAAVVLKQGWPDTPAGNRELASFDDWLRADGHRRNPGTTADLVAATIFAHIREAERTGECSPFMMRPNPPGS